MKVFLSWSGDLSKNAACILRDWLPSVIQSIEPYVSSEDIEKGSRWATDIAKELESSFFGIICVTKDNYSAPWVNFEAGALSKTVNSARVCPFLVNLKKAELPQCPLLQFQLTVYEKEDVFRLITGINASLEEGQRLDDPRLKRGFDVWWPELQRQLDELLKASDNAQVAKQVSTEKKPHLVEEILDLVREQQKVLRSPEILFPPDYLLSVLGQGGHILPHGELRNVSMSLRSVSDRQVNLANRIRQTKAMTDADIGELIATCEEVHQLAQFLSRPTMPRMVTSRRPGMFPSIVQPPSTMPNLTPPPPSST